MGKPPVMERSEFGERLFLARTHAKLGQEELAKKAGMGQSTIAHLEKAGKGSSRTRILAEICGVRAAWLDSGEGPMLDTSEVPPAANTVASEQVAHYLVGTPAGNDYRTIALTLAAALEESGTELTVSQFVKLLEATYAKLRP